MILTIIFKNLKIILRSPITVLFLIIAPMFLMYVVGISYSNSTLSNTNIGIVSSDINFFNDLNSKINLKNYTNNELNDCIKDLKKSKIDLCINSEFKKDKSNNIKSATISYYVDNTRAGLSQILINYFNYFIDKKTKEISAKTVNDIFIEIKNTTNFLEYSQNFTLSLENDLSNIKNNLVTFQILYKYSKNNFESEYNKLNFLINSSNFQIDNLINENDNFNKNLILIKNNLENSIDSINYISNSVHNLEYSLDNYAKNNDNLIYTYVNLNNINKILSDLDNISTSLKDSSNLIESINFNSFNHLGDINDRSNNIFKLFSNIKDNLDKGNLEIQNMINILDEKEKNLNEINKKINNKLIYFKDLSNYNESEITQPLIKKSFFLFSNFKRVHKLAPTIVILVLLFIGLLLSNVIVSMEINSKAYFRNLISPISQVQFVIALFFTSLLIILFQIFFLLIVLYFYFGINNIFSNFFQLFFVLIHLLTLFILLGILLAYSFISIQMSILFTTFIMLFLFLLSSIVVPVQIMPSFVAFYVKLNPVVIGENLIRRIFYFSKDLIPINDFFIFYFYIFILIILIYFAVINRSKKLI